MRRFNVNESIWFAILLGFTYYVYHLISTDKILVFIHPKMLKYVYFSFAVFMILSGVQLKRIFSRHNRESIKIGYILFLIPLILGFAVDPTGLSASVAAKKGVTVSGNKGSITIEGSEEEAFLQDGTILFNDEDFLYTMDEIYNNMEKYKGNKVVITGFVFREENFQENEFVVARLLMNCCAADSQVIGLFSRGEAGKIVEEDEWVRVMGTLDVTAYHDAISGEDTQMPVIQVEEIEKIEKPATQYVYP
ncbi:putative membrane protein [Anaerosolibacter carboniphilus]|uniref:Putative membrane protein n=1 Tax=Anaerosolibacter carboniphilus TaxID=1417629 RepID=A0A841KTN1_9FIRM|nr:TIGR03943 family protein [Anaerosolibacter carboniphilus]MBB6216781.1 putative membrane protein [Anaerosolibacter carboniphilus]